MKRDLDFLRELLLEIENYCEVGKLLKKKHSRDDADNKATIKTTGHLKLLIDEEFIEVIDATDQNNVIFFIRRLTSKGHDYLDSVRDPKIWRDTKVSLKKVGGAVPLAIVQALAVSVAKQALGLS